MTKKLDRLTKKVDRAHARHRCIVDLRNDLERTFLQLAEHLYWFSANRDYWKLGHPSMRSYVADPDVDISWSLYQRLRGIYKLFVLGLECPPGGLLEAGSTKLDKLAKHVRTGDIGEDNVDEWVANAAALSRSDLEQELAVAFGVERDGPTDYRRWAYAWKRAAKRWRKRAMKNAPQKRA